MNGWAGYDTVPTWILSKKNVICSGTLGSSIVILATAQKMKPPDYRKKYNWCPESNTQPHFYGCFFWKLKLAVKIGELLDKTQDINSHGTSFRRGLNYKQIYFHVCRKVCFFFNVTLICCYSLFSCTVYQKSHTSLFFSFKCLQNFCFFFLFLF